LFHIYLFSYIIYQNNNNNKAYEIFILITSEFATKVQLKYVIHLFFPIVSFCKLYKKVHFFMFSH